jgi:GNAT superfamily N-acetyltransferase
MMPGANDSARVRGARPNDAAALASLAGELGYPATDAQMGARFAAVSSNPDHAILVAEHGGMVVGWIHATLTQSLETDRCAEIRGLVVGRNHRGSGIGTMLVAAAEGWARERGCPRIRVRTNVTREDAGAFYTKLGFQSTKTQTVFDRALETAAGPVVDFRLKPS